MSSCRTAHCALLAVLGLLIGLTATVGAGPQSGPYRTYLPLVVRGSGGTTPPPAPTPTTPPAGASGALLYGDASYRSAGVAVDGQGGMHAIFSKTVPLLGDEQRAVYYAYCPPADASACGRLDGWQIAAIDKEPEGWAWAQLKLTPGGKPRVLLVGTFMTDASSGAYSTFHRYAECDAGCGQAGSWRSIDVVAGRSYGGLYDADYSYRTFALDHQGRPRFIFEARDASSGGYIGPIYAHCDARCAEPATWELTQIAPTDERVFINEHSQLAFTPDGRPRVFGLVSGSLDDPSYRLVYLECDTACGEGASWSPPTRLFSTGSGPGHFSWSAAFDVHGRPRLAFYPLGGPLSYTWCDAACGQAASWEGYSLGLGLDSGAFPSLALDGQGRPRLAYRASVDDMGYAWCDLACEGDAAQWRFHTAEDGSAILADLSVPLVPGCLRGDWFGGLRPVLALGADGNPRIAYDAEFKMECKRYPDDPNSTLTFVETKWWTSRVLFFPQPR